MVRLFRIFIPAGVLILLISEILLVTVVFLIAVAADTDVDPEVFLLYEDGLVRIGLVAAIIVLGLHFHDLYARIRITSKMMLLQQLVQVIGIALLVQGMVGYVNPSLTLPRRQMVMGSAIALLLLYTWRIFYTSYVLKLVGNQRILFVGRNAVVQDVASYIEEHPELGREIAGYIDNAYEPGTRINGKEILGPVNSVRKIASDIKPDRIVVGVSERRNGMPLADLLQLRFADYIVEEASTAYEVILGRVCVHELKPGEMILSSELGPRPKTLAFQTIFNYALAALGAVVTLPLLLFAAVGVKMSSAGQVLERRKRAGLNGTIFSVYRFRTVRFDGEPHGGPVYCSTDDPRITRVGRMLRRFRLDELPQLFNVLRGEMSVVGPRPERPEYVKALSEQIPYYRQRLCVKPGMIGWAQANQESGDYLKDTMKELEYDLYYIKNMSQSLDAYILVRALNTMILSRQAQRQ